MSHLYRCHFDVPEPEMETYDDQDNDGHGRKLAPPSPILTLRFTYNYPKYGGYNLDWCYSWGIDCGKRAADRYCTSKGHYSSTGYSQNANVGNTKLIGTNQLCPYSWCDGFKAIDCIQYYTYGHP